MVELEIQDYNYNVKFFNRVKNDLLKNLTCINSIEHVGSTAIPNMYGKNILDVLVGVKNQADFDKTFKEILGLKFRASKNTESNFYHFFASAEGETKSGDVHIHLAIENTERYKEFLLLRNYLLSHEDEAKKYSEHKIYLTSHGVTDRKEYRTEKSKYVAELIARAKEFYKFH